MMKQNKFKIIISSVITLLPMFFGIIVWDMLPEKIATSFGLNGEIKGYSGKLFTVVGFPVILTLVNLICIIATNADPRKKNIDEKVFTVVISVVPICSLVCGTCIYGNALGYTVNAEKIMSLFVGAIILVLGFILPKCKQNYTIGIKLPWTLHSEENWNKTHKFAGKLWFFGGLVMIAAGFLNLEILFVAVLFAIVIIPTVYSYMLFRKNKIS